MHCILDFFFGGGGHHCTGVHAYVNARWHYGKKSYVFNIWATFYQYIWMTFLIHLKDFAVMSGNLPSDEWPAWQACISCRGCTKTIMYFLIMNEPLKGGVTSKNKGGCYRKMTWRRIKGGRAAILRCCVAPVRWLHPAHCSCALWKQRLQALRFHP